MAVSNIKAVFKNNIQDVWNVVTSLGKYQWRSDLSKIEIINENQFIEYTKEGYATLLPLPFPSLLSVGSLILKTVI